VTTSQKFHQNPFSILAKQKKYDGTEQIPGQRMGQEDRLGQRWTRHNAMPPLQQKVIN